LRFRRNTGTGRSCPLPQGTASASVKLKWVVNKGKTGAFAAVNERAASAVKKKQVPPLERAASHQLHQHLRVIWGEPTRSAVSTPFYATHFTLYRFSRRLQGYFVSAAAALSFSFSLALSSHTLSRAAVCRRPFRCCRWAPAESQRRRCCQARR
jgi:hypothetical protein